MENATATAPAAEPVKRYAPPNQRNRSLGRRKSGERFDRTNSLYGSEGEKYQLATSRNFPVVDHKDTEAVNLSNDNPHLGLVGLQGCYNSEASRLLRERWTAVMHCYNDPSVDLSERPVMYMGTGASVWGQFRLPHQLMQGTRGIGPGSQMDFLGELQQAIHNANTSSNI